MDLRKAIEFGSALGGGCPAAFICGRPPRILASSAWKPELTEPALRLWDKCRSDAMLETTLLLAYPAHGAAEGRGRVRIGLLVVALPPGPKRVALYEHLKWVARAIERLDGSLVAGLVERLQARDPDARRDLLRVLKYFKFNVRDTADAIGVCRGTLYKYIRAYHIQLDRVVTGVRGARTLHIHDDDDDRD